MPPTEAERSYARWVNRLQAKLAGRAATIERLLDQLDTLRVSNRWRVDERERAFKALGVDDYPNGDLPEAIREAINPAPVVGSPEE